MNKTIFIAVAFFGAAAFKAQAQLPQAEVEVIATLDYPWHNVATVARKISNDRRLAGEVTGENNRTVGFQWNGPRTLSDPIIYPGASITDLLSINSSGRICGTFYDGLDDHGFFYDGTAFTQYDVPGQKDTVIYDENDGGDFVGTYGSTEGFANFGGVLAQISVPESVYTTPLGINDHREIVGTASDQHATTGGFYRDAGGTVMFPIYFPDGMGVTDLADINDQDIIVGSTFDQITGTNHGLILTLPDDFTPYDVPGSVATGIFGINNANMIVGYYVGTDYVFHGFVARLRVTLQADMMKASNPYEECQRLSD